MTADRMAPARVHRYPARSPSTGITFTVLFAVLACLVIGSCFVWGFLIPYIRRRYSLLNPSGTKFKYPSQSRNRQQLEQSVSRTTLIQSSSRRRLRSTILRRQSPVLTVYHPRLHTPFPRAPSQGESIALQTYSTPRIVSPALNTSQSLFTPTRSRISTCPVANVPRSYTLPRVRSQSEFVRSQDADKEFGDAREYILALPEPLRVRPQAQENDFVPLSPMESLPQQKKFLPSADKHLHPNKLFEQVHRQAPDNSAVSSTSLRTREYAGDSNEAGGSNVASMDVVPVSSRQSTEPFPGLPHASRERISVLPQQSIEDLENLPSGLQPYSERTTLTSIESDLTNNGSESESEPHNESTRAMHVLRTYRSLVGAPPVRPMARAGTLTRPKTPVAKMRDMYDRSVSEGRPTQRSVSRNDTISTFIRTIANSSDRQSPQSSATSPPKASPQNFTASATSLLPTPLRINHNTKLTSPKQRDFAYTVDPDNSNNDSSTQMQTGPERQDQTRLQIHDGAAPALTTRRTRPPPLKLTADPQSSQQQSLDQAQISNRDGSRASNRLYVPRMRASSVYSRDTQGVSIAQTPATPDFTTPVNYRPPFSPWFPSTVGDATDSDKGTETNLIKAEASPRDTAEHKVNEWKVDMGHLAFNTSSPAPEGAVPMTNPDRASDHKANEPRHSVISTEITPSEKHLSNITGPLRVSNT